MICQSITRSSGLSVPVTQGYAYNDPANRLTGFGETGGCAQTYGYDAFGNRGVTAASTCVVSGTDVTPQPGEFTNNRWTKFAATLYDASGNLKQTATRTNQTTPSNFFTYDGENRMITSNVGGMGIVNYVYDGQGQRVQKWWTAGNCPGNPATCTTTYVYAQGQLAVEISNVPSTSLPATEYLTADHLGSTRLVTDGSGNPVACYDYLPFGEELGQGMDGRLANGCYPASVVFPQPTDATSLKFTTKERDAETGLDYFGARYMSSAQGRRLQGWRLRMRATPQ